jgi:hypothetical protein
MNFQSRPPLTIADPEIVADGALAPPAFHPHPMPRTITHGILVRVEAGHAKAP